jgi:hypothetical protein
MQARHTCSRILLLNQRIRTGNKVARVVEPDLLAGLSALVARYRSENDPF